MSISTRVFTVDYNVAEGGDVSLATHFDNSEGKHYEYKLASFILDRIRCCFTRDFSSISRATILT